MKFRKYIAITSAACMLFAGAASPALALTVSAEEEKQYPTSGTFENITWNFDAETKTLTVSGKGATGTYFYENTGLARTSCPWAAFRDDIEKIVVSEGITKIGYGLFTEHLSLKSVQLPESLTAIAAGAFAECFSLAEINIPESVTEFGANAFFETAWLKTRQAEERQKMQRGEVYYPLVIENGILIDGTKSGTDGIPQSAVSLTVPSGVKAIADGAFWKAEGIKGINDFGGNTVRIGAYVCEGSSIEEFVTSLQTQYIGRNACYNCPNLEKVTISNPMCRIYDSKWTFSNAETGDKPFKGTIYGYTDSTAQAYAEKYGYKFESTRDSTPIRPGDTNMDNHADLEDAQFVLEFYTETLAGKDPLIGKAQKQCADVNSDGTADVMDAQYILKYYTENEVAKKFTTWEEILK